jgi:hypothetical protein
VNNKNIPSTFSEYELEKDLKVMMCQKEFQRRMVLEKGEDNLEKVAVEILEKGKGQTDKNAIKLPAYEEYSKERFETRIY